MLQELEALNRIRLNDDLTYEELGRQIGIRGPTLQRLLNKRRHRPYDRTLHKIQQFLTKYNEATRGTTARKKPRR